MELDRTLVGQVDHAGGVVDDRIVDDGPGPRGDVVEPGGKVLLVVLLKEATAIDPLGVADHAERTAAQLGHHQLGDVAVVGDQLTFGDAICGKHHATDVAARDRDVAEGVLHPARIAYVTPCNAEVTSSVNDLAGLRCNVSACSAFFSPGRSSWWLAPGRRALAPMPVVLHRARLARRV